MMDYRFFPNPRGCDIGDNHEWYISYMLEIEDLSKSKTKNVYDDFLIVLEGNQIEVPKGVIVAPDRRNVEVQIIDVLRDMTFNKDRCASNINEAFSWLLDLKPNNFNHGIYIKELSRKFPDVIFKLYGERQYRKQLDYMKNNDAERWVIYFKNGKSQYESEQLQVLGFDENKLK